VSEPIGGGAPAGDGHTGGPVTTVVTRHVRSGHGPRYEEALQRLLVEARALDGYLGAEVHPPGPGAPQLTYTSVFRFDSLDHLRAFEASELRARFLAEVAEHVEADAVWSTSTGLELWFDPPAGTVVAQPVRWRMAVVLGVVVYILVLVLGSAAAALLGDVPAPLRLALVIAIEIVLMTYLVLPRVTRLFSGWIYPTAEVVGAPGR
jgi:antibiotic biosynthesis monooxygenase (ABM) superfamily enzyme